MVFSRESSPLWGLAALSVALLVYPFLTDNFQAYQLGTFLLYGVTAQGIALCWGRTGFMSLGQSLYFGLGAYLGAKILISVAGNTSLFLALPVVILVPAALAFIVARLVFARQSESGVNFSLITMALAMLGWQISNRWSGVTGGFNGLSGVPEIGGLGRYDSYYYLIVLFAVSSTAMITWLYKTPLGTLLGAVRQNEPRLQFLGFSTASLKATAFAISAAMAGLAGFLFAAQQGLVSPTVMSFQLSAELVIWTAVGGRFGPYGALLGAVVIGTLSTYLREIWVDWEILVALVFIVVVIWLPGGIASIFGLMTRKDARGTSSDTKPDGNFIVAPGTDEANTPSPDRGISLTYEDVSIRIGEVQILDGLTMNFGEQGAHCIIGPNGAGKTSAFNVLTGQLPISGGCIVLDGQRINGKQPHVVARLGVARKFQIPSVLPEMTVHENLTVALWANRVGPVAMLKMAPWMWRSEMWDWLEEQLPFLADDADRLAGELSQGQRQMLELAMTLLTEPRLLLLDEPCAGLSPAETDKQVDVILKAVQRLGNTAMVIEHDMAAVRRLSRKVHVLHQGALLFCGSVAEMKSSAKVQAVYIGGSK